MAPAAAGDVIGELAPAAQIWRLVSRIPKGRVATYGEIARAVRPPCSPRWVAVALRKAPEAMRLPWHRVVAAGGRIALGGEAAWEQRFRLEREQVEFCGRRVRMDRHAAEILGTPAKGRRVPIS